MKIAIDCRYLGKSGIGRVCRGIIDNLDYQENEYFLVGKKDALKGYDATVIEDNTDPFSKKGMLVFNKEINKKCDVLLTPNFIIPLGIKIPVYSIIHDLIFLDLKKMTKGFIDGLIKKYLLKRCVKKSKKVFCVSEFTKSRCIHYYKKYADKFIVNYNGLSDSVLAYDKTIDKRKGDLVFVGNVKPHKGLKTLVEALNLLGDGYTLKIIGEKDNFITGLNTDGMDSKNVVFTGRLDDDKLLDEIAGAEFLIQPSESERFGIPPFEALYLGTKPIVSDIEVFREVYKDFPVDFFSCKNEVDLKEKILSANPIIPDQKEKIKGVYSYKNTAKTIVENITVR
jgi:glycosyltransferase involved in cell wall biosynthesis